MKYALYRTGYSSGFILPIVNDEMITPIEVEFQNDYSSGMLKEIAFKGPMKQPIIVTESEILSKGETSQAKVERIKEHLAKIEQEREELTKMLEQLS